MLQWNADPPSHKCQNDDNLHHQEKQSHQRKEGKVGRQLLSDDVAVAKVDKQPVGAGHACKRDQPGHFRLVYDAPSGSASQRRHDGWPAKIALYLRQQVGGRSLIGQYPRSSDQRAIACSKRQGSGAGAMTHHVLQTFIHQEGCTPDAHLTGVCWRRGLA